MEPTKSITKNRPMSNKESDWLYISNHYSWGIVALGRTVKNHHCNDWRKKDWEKVDATIRRRLTDLASRQSGALSDGQFQRVLLARCMVQEAQYIFLDEPFVELICSVRKSLWRLSINGRGRKDYFNGQPWLTYRRWKNTFDQVILVRNAISLWENRRRIH